MNLRIDAHCHLDAYKKINIINGYIPITSGYSFKSSIKNHQIALQYNIPYTVGIAPQTVLLEKITENSLEHQLKEFEKMKMNAVGEIGLDFKWAKSNEEKKQQENIFLKMLEFAEKKHLPVVIHSRNAEKKVLEILEEWGWKRGFMMHFFSGTLEEAKKAVSMEGYISIPPVPSKERKKIINEIEIKHLMVETDSPYVSKHYVNVEDSIKYISEIKNVDYDEVALITSENAKRFFHIKVKT